MQGELAAQLVIQLVVWVICGGICSAIASSKGRTPVGWFFGGLLGIIGIIIIAVLPKHCIGGRHAKIPIERYNVSA